MTTDDGWHPGAPGFPRREMMSEPTNPMQEVLDFLESIEGAGYGGMASFEIARAHVRGMLNPAAGAQEPVAWLDVRTTELSWQNRIVATNPQYVENNGPDNFVALYTAPSQSFDRSVIPWRTDFENAPNKEHEFFLVRPQGLHRGKPYHPTIVQRSNGEFYTADNELEPIYFGQNEAPDHPLKTTLEWKPFPADWCTITRPERGGPA